MAELKDLLPITKSLSLLYIDEDQEFLTTITTALKKVFLKVDDADDATLAMGYLKVNSYDIVVVDSSSSIMSVENLVKNILNIHSYQNIILTTKKTASDELLSFYTLGISALLNKPFKASLLLDKILDIAIKLQHNRNFLQAQIEKLNSDLLYERKRIGRFMLNEKKSEEKLKEYANSISLTKNIYDLTRLPSKNALQNALDGKLQALIYINIDHFDFVNTIYGMGNANKLLKACAKQLALFLPINAELFHITADEFVILLDEPASNQEKLLSEQIQALFKESPVEFDEYSHYIVFSIGIAKGEGKRLFVNAKAASKEARYYGGSQIVKYNSTSDYMMQQKESLYWISVLKKAFEEDRIFTYYQPIVSSSTNEVEHYEVLCRLTDENNKLIDAKNFIESAKLIGLATQITKTVIDKAFKAFKVNEHKFSINITMYDLHENYLIEFLNYKCQRYAIDASRVHLEIVEDILMTKTDMIDNQIFALKEAGFNVIIDDFSSDRSAYSRMFELKAEYIKIDGSFIKKLAEDKSFVHVVKSIVDFAKSSGIKTIAEHIESETINEIVKKLGVDYLQGYYIGKPSLSL
jgi:EAL domain-containing protein (putative c-di-GMP-specific phosphodiesterase class I)/GGDEF domain-containing protein/AmiR/NasT family two-component response regulator